MVLADLKFRIQPARMALAVIVLLIAAGEGQKALAQGACLDQVQGQFSLRVMSAFEIDAAVEKRVSWLVSARERGLQDSNRVEFDEILRAEYTPLATELARLAEASLTRAEALQFRASLKSLLESRESLTNQIERLNRALEPAGLLSRILRQEKKRSEAQAALEKGILTCRDLIANCVVDLNNATQDYRNLHEIYRRIGRVTEQQSRIWQMVAARPEVGGEARLIVEQYLGHLAKLRVIITGLVSSSEADLISAAQHIQFSQTELPVILTGLVSRGASRDLLAPVRLRFQLEADEAVRKRAEEEAARRSQELSEQQLRELGAQRPAKPSSASHSEAFIKAHEQRSDRIEATLASTASNHNTRLDLFYERVKSMAESSDARYSAEQALWILNSFEPGKQGLGWDREGLSLLTSKINRRLGQSWASTSTFRTFVDSEFLVILLTVLAPEPRAEVRAAFLAKADAHWLASKNLRSNLKAEYRSDMEMLWRLLKREWEERSAAK